MTTVTLPKIRCKRCGHRWTARVANPVRCPRCTSLYWDKARAGSAESGEVAARTAAGIPNVKFDSAGDLPALDGASHPSLVAVWDNDDDAIFDRI